MMRMKFGIMGLDKMLNGGLVDGKVYMLVGEHGSGKTLLSLRFLLEGLNNGESCLYIAVDKPPALVLQGAMLGFGWNLSSLRVMDAVPSEALYSTTPSIRDITAKGEITMAQHSKKKNEEKGELSIEGLTLKLLDQMKSVRFNRIVLDSLSLFKRFGIDEDKEFMGIHRLINFFKQTGATTIITSTQNVNLKAEYLLSAGVIEIEKRRGSAGYERYIRIVKMRGSDYDRKTKRMYITEDGIFVLR